MKKRACIQLIITVLLVLTMAGASGAEPGLQPSSVPGIMVQEGFDAEVFATGLQLPIHLTRDDTGNILVPSNCGTCPVVRLSPGGDVIASSEPIRDPDGVAVDTLGRVFVAGDGKITIANSLDGGSDVVFATGFTNLNNIAIDSANKIVVAENDGRIREVNAAGVIVEPPLAALGSVGNPLAFDDTDRLFAGRHDPSDQEGELFRIDAPGVVTLISNAVNPCEIAVGRGGVFGSEIYVAEFFRGSVQKVDEDTGTVTLFASGLDGPAGLVFDSTNALLVSERDLGRIIRIFSCVLEATFDIDPDTLNLKSKGKWMTCYIELPDGYTASDIDVATVVLTIGGTSIPIAEASPTEVGDYDSDDIPDLMVKFDRAAVQGLVAAGSVEMTVSGSLTDGAAFQGVDTVLVIDKGREHTNEVDHSSVIY